MVQALFPLIDGITAVLLTALEALKGYFGIKVAKYNNQIRQITMAEEEEPSKSLIGFCRQEDEDE